eukprot:362608-Chlamydomonas_euryale.AAC.3
MGTHAWVWMLGCGCFGEDHGDAEATEDSARGQSPCPFPPPRRPKAAMQGFVLASNWAVISDEGGRGRSS